MESEFSDSSIASSDMPARLSSLKAGSLSTLDQCVPRPVLPILPLMRDHGLLDTVPEAEDYCRQWSNASPHSAPICFNEPQSFCHLHVVVGRYDEDVSWVRAIPSLPLHFPGRFNLLTEIVNPNSDQ